MPFYYGRICHCDAIPDGPLEIIHVYQPLSESDKANANLVAEFFY